MSYHLFYFFRILQLITDEAVHKLAEHCHGLHYLCLSGCTLLTDASLIILAQQCHMLSTLEVAGCSQFTDAGFQALARVSCIQVTKKTVLVKNFTIFHDISELSSS